MMKYRIGTTENGDAGLDLSWTGRMAQVDGAVLTSRSLNPEFASALLRYRNSVVLHIAMSGYGYSVLEPRVPKFESLTTDLCQLVEQGFPADHVVIRVDPIVPTEKGLMRSLEVMEHLMECGFWRFRVALFR